jgi:hypothetical protein
MSVKSIIRCFAVLIVATTLAHAQISPISPTAAAQPPAALASQPTPASHVAHRAEVTFTNGQLQVVADDSGLNQILRAIAHETGMKITGGVSDERVFGKYGPAAPGQVLATLLDGTGSNMLLVQTAQDAPAELILTPRQGGPTPPNPNASRDDDESPPPNQQSTAPILLPQVAPAVQPPGSAGIGTPAPANTNAGANAQATGTTDPQTLPSSPNGVKTPQQIYQELQLLRQQQQQPPAPQ